jgi:hypothetical protein
MNLQQADHDEVMAFVKNKDHGFTLQDQMDLLGLYYDDRDDEHSHHTAFEKLKQSAEDMKEERD